MHRRSAHIVKFTGHLVGECRKLKGAKAKGDDTAKSKPADASAKIAVAEEEPESDSDRVRLFSVS